MDLKGIITIKGKSGLYKIISPSSAKVCIVEAFEDKKRFPVSNAYGVTPLDSLSVFLNDEEELNVADIFSNIKNLESQNPVPDSHEDTKVLKEFFRKAVPDFDESRVYDSHIKKIISWYHILNNNNCLDKSDDTKTE